MSAELYPGQNFYWRRNERIQRNEEGFWRAWVVAEARTWMRTPYHKGGQVKGAGCDCATLLYCIWRACDLIPEEHIGVFAGDWFCHVSDEIYMRRILRHAWKVVEGVSFISDKTLPGNIVLARVADSKVYNHGAIITAWPKVIHALSPHVAEVDATKHWAWAHHELAIFDPWAKLRGEQ